MDIFSSINSQVQNLAHIYRYTMLPVHRKESVAEHSFFVALYASWIARDLRRRGHEVNMEKVLLGAINHDLSEGKTGDLWRGFKYTTPELRAEIARAEKLKMKEFSKQLGDEYQETYDLAEHAKDPNTIEGRIVELCDQLGLLAYIREELLMGNKYFEPVAKRAHDYIHGSAKGELAFYYDQIYPNGKWDDILRSVPGQDD